MYDRITSAVLFFLLAPGVLLTLPPGASPVLVALVHAVVFWVVQTYLFRFVPWWVLWIVAGLTLVFGLFRRTSTPSYSTY